MVSPTLTNAWDMLNMASLEPRVTQTSVSGSTSTPNLTEYHLAIASLRHFSPCDDE